MRKDSYYATHQVSVYNFCRLCRSAIVKYPAGTQCQSEPAAVKRENRNLVTMSRHAMLSQEIAIPRPTTRKGRHKKTNNQPECA